MSQLNSGCQRASGVVSSAGERASDSMRDKRVSRGSFRRSTHGPPRPHPSAREPLGVPCSNWNAHPPARSRAGTRTSPRVLRNWRKSSSRTDYEDCPGRSACRTRSAARLWRHGTHRFLSHRGAGSAGARRHPVRQRRLDHGCGARPRRAGGAETRLPDPRSHSLSSWPARAGPATGSDVRRTAFPHRPLPFPAAAGNPDSGADDPAWPARPARSPPLLPAVRRRGPGLDLRCAASSHAAGQLARDDPPRPAGRPAGLQRQARGLSGLPRKDLAGEAARPGDRHRREGRCAAEDRGEDRRRRP